MFELSGRNCRDPVPALFTNSHSGGAWMSGVFATKKRSFLFIDQKKQNKRIPTDLSRRVEFVDKLLFMESLVTGWGMCGKIVGKTVFLFHDFSMHYPRGYQ